MPYGAFSGTDLSFVLSDLEQAMLKTIIIGSCVSVQGTFVKTLANGLVVVRVGQTEFAGRPVVAA
jgi:hypothetical protein